MTTLLTLMARGLRAAWPKGIGALGYAFVLILVFAGVYQSMDLTKHLVMDDTMKGKENSFLTSLYLSVTLQTNSMPDMTPRTSLMRILFMLQVVAGWMWFVM